MKRSDGPEPRWVHCAEGCGAKIRDHAWGKIKAEGWFFSMAEDKAYCPVHNPPWVAEWRERKKVGCPHYRVRKYDTDDGPVYRCEKCQVVMIVSADG